MTMPNRPLDMMDIRTELSYPPSHSIGLRDDEVYELATIPVTQPIGVVDLEGASSGPRPMVLRTIVDAGTIQINTQTPGVIVTIGTAPPVTVTGTNTTVYIPEDVTKVTIAAVNPDLPLAHLYINGGTQLTDVIDFGVYEYTDLRYNDSTALVSVPGSVPPWLTDMRRMFYDCTSFNGDLSEWDVSSVTDMTYMFYRCRAFNGDLSEWDVSSVTDMTYMFYRCNTFNSDLSMWDTSNVTSVYGMFNNCTAFNGDLSQWDVSRVTTMLGMFYRCRAFNGDLSGWDVSSVTNMSSMFLDASAFNQDLSTWDVSSVTTMMDMFQNAKAFNGDISTWDTSRVTDMRRMFRDASAFNQDLSWWCVSKIPTIPSNFDYSAASWVLPRPVWGTCPPRL